MVADARGAGVLGLPTSAIFESMYVSGDKFKCRPWSYFTIKDSYFLSQKTVDKFMNNSIYIVGYYQNYFLYNYSLLFWIVSNILYY